MYQVARSERERQEGNRETADKVYKKSTQILTRNRCCAKDNCNDVKENPPMPMDKDLLRCTHGVTNPFDNVKGTEGQMCAWPSDRCLRIDFQCGEMGPLQDQCKGSKTPPSITMCGESYMCSGTEIKPEWTNRIVRD